MKTTLVIFIAIVTIVFLSQAAYTQPGDAGNGAILFSQKCSRCHGASGQGGIGPSLIGCSDCDSIDSLFDKIDDDMPFDNPTDCIDSCAWDTAAYIFEVLNGNPTATTTTSASSTTTTAFSSTTTIGEGPCPAEEIYGEYSEETKLLRYFRNEILNQTPEGQELIRLYYEWSPVIVRAIEKDEAFKEEVKEMIDGVLGLITEEVE
jgi:hypothetical protein